MFEATIVLLSLQGNNQLPCSGYLEANSYCPCGASCGIGCTENGGEGYGGGMNCTESGGE